MEALNEGGEFCHLQAAHSAASSPITSTTCAIGAGFMSAAALLQDQVFPSH